MRALWLRRVFEYALLLGFALGGLYAVARVGLEPRDPAKGVGVVFAPWTSADAALERAVGPGARFVRFGGFSFVVVVVPEADSREYLHRIKASGAWLVVDPAALAACLSAFSIAQVG